MRSAQLNTAVKSSVLALTILLFVAGTSFAQSTVNLTATRQTATLPDGNAVPMWGWVCGTGTTGATCTATSGQPQTALAGGVVPWQPPLIVVPIAAGQTVSGSFTIKLANSLPVETSLTIVGQLPGGGLGTPAREASPRNHPTQTETTWTTSVPGTFIPPTQGLRVRSFAPEIAPNTAAATSYTWAALKPGTYLIESGTYPSIQGPMGLYGVLVVTTEPTLSNSATTFIPGPGTAYPNIKYDADIPLLLSEIDPAQNNAVEQFLEAQAGCSTTTPGTGTCTGSISATLATTKWTAACGTAHSCYPAAVNYTPLYYLVNGKSFDLTANTFSAAPIPVAASTGNVLLRFVNAGSRMHVPAVNGLNMSLVAEDGNVLPDVALAAGSIPAKPLTVRVQSDVFLPAGKVYDVMISPANTAVPPAAPTAFKAGNYLVFDRELSLSTNGWRHDGGMQTLLQVAGGVTTNPATAAAYPDKYDCVPGVNLTISDPGKGVAANDVNVNGVTLVGNPAKRTLTPFGGGSLTLNPDGTFTYIQPATATGTCGGNFSYYANGNVTIAATVTIIPSPTLSQKPVANPDAYSSNIASLLRVAAPGVLVNDADPNHYPLCAVPVGATSCPSTAQTITAAGGTVLLKPDGSFTVTMASPPTSGTATATFQYMAMNSEKTASSPTTVSVTFKAGSGLQVRVQDAQTPTTQITDYKWIIEQDRTFHIDPGCQQNGAGGSKPSNCPTGVPPTLGTNFHTSYMPVVAVGCTGPQSCERDQTVFNPVTGAHDRAVCDGGVCVPAGAGAAAYLPTTLPANVNLPTTDANGNPVYYYISVLPGDAANPFNTGTVSAPNASCFAAGSGSTATGQSTAMCGHTMGGAPIRPACTASGTTSTCTLPTSVTVNVEPSPLPTSTVTVFVFEDDWPLNGEPQPGGGPDTYPVHEVGLGDFQVMLWDDAGSSGDPTGQMTYDMFNMPLTNSLAGMIDPVTGVDSCPISDANGSAPPVGVIIVCPAYEADGVTPSPLIGQAVIKNLMPGRFGVIVHPGAAREARGEEWLQTNTLDGTHALDSFVKMAEPAYFQEFGPGGYHVFMGMANPQIINSRLHEICTASPVNPTPPACNNTVNGQLTNLHQARSPNEQLFSSGVFAHGNPANYAPLNYTSCYATLGDSDAATIAFAKCDPDGNFKFTGIPDGSYGLVVFDQWLDMIVDGSSKTVNVAGGKTFNLDYSAFTWQTHLWANTFMDLNQNGIQDTGEPGLIQVPSRVRMRNGKFNNALLSDSAGQAHFDETFPLFNWYVTESDNTRFRNTGVHVVNDAGGQVDGPSSGGFTPGNGTTGPYQGILNSKETFSVPANLRIPGAVYCGRANCTDANLRTNPSGGGPGGSTGRIDPGSVVTEGWQGGVSEFNMIDWGKIPYATGENGGIRGHVVYSSTRPFDDPTQLFQNLWEPLVPGVTINLYQEGTAPDGTQSLTLVDTTKTSSWDDWAQGFRANGVPNMNCPGQDLADPFFASTLAGTRNYLNPTTALPNNSQYKCFDGFHNLNQIQPAPYDGLYQFPSAFCATNAGGTFTAPSGQAVKCATVANPALRASVHTGAAPAVLQTGKYVVEAVTPPNYEITKEEDKNILIGDNYIAPVTQQFGGLGNIFIVPDQATVNNTNLAYGTGGGATNPTTDFGRNSIGGFGPGALILMPAPCVGQLRVVPDFMSMSPESGEVAPFAGATRPLCDRKELTLEDQMQAQTDFFVWTKTPAAAHFAGFITDDFSSEFDPAAPAFGEKFAVPNSPISIKDYNGVEVTRIYSDQWGIYNGLVFSTWQVNPPNPTGYAPAMQVACMNDPGPILDTRPGSPTLGQMITDPSYNPSYSDFCYEWPFMPSDTAYMDTPVVPVAAFADGYNPPDCNYPDATPAIKSVTGDPIPGGGTGPWVSAPGHTLTITALGDQLVPNHAYSGPAATTSPYNQKFITRHYGFGSTAGQVNIDGAIATITSWSDTTIKVVVPSEGVSRCRMQQVGAPNARCGELVITTANGQTSIDTVTVTVGGKAPIYVPGTYKTIQAGIDAASPGDLVIVGPGTYNEMLLMWKPVRLQGVGAPSVIVNANAHPAGKLLEPWRRKVNCLFGLAMDGGFISSTHAYDPSGQFPCTTAMQGRVDPVPLESVVGWTPSLNGNILELLQEPTLMGAYEGAAITALAKGVENNNTANCSAANATQSGCIYLNSNTGTAPNNGYNNGLGDCNPASQFYPTNYLCNPSRIDGISFTNSSQGGGGIFVHGWGDNLEISNNRVFSNGGTLGGGIIVGNAESPSASFNQSVASFTIPNPGSGYTTAPLVTLSAPIATGPLVGTQATAVATISNVVGPITVVTGGSGYLVTNTVVLTGGGGTGASAVIGAVDATGAITAITLVQPGVGYTSAPTVSFISATGTGASATASFVTGGVSTVTVTNPGSLYTSVPTVTFTGGGGSGAVATAVLTAPSVQIPFFLNYNVYMHHNSVTGNTSYGDELNSTTPSSAGGAVFCDGSDYYRFQFNWVCGNISTADGGGVAHFGFSYNGNISNNWILFNQSSNPTLTTHGGGLVVMGLGPDGITGCGETNDIECPPQVTDGVGPNTVISGNVIMGNTAESGSGGGIRLQHINGTDIQRNPSTPSLWYQVNVNNNIIANNVAGWAGGGVSLHNAVRVNFRNNTVASNDTTSSAGVLFDSSGASFSTVPPPGCDPNSPPSATNNCSNSVITQSNFLPAGLETEMHDATLLTSFTNPAVQCGEDYSHCTKFSNPLMENNIFWQNRAFRITTGTVPTAPGLETTVQLVPALTQSTIGSCPSGANYWDIGVYGDTSPTNHSSGLTLHPAGSILSSGSYGSSNSSANPGFAAQYCNGSRVPPEIASLLCSGPNGRANASGCIQPGTVGVSMTVPTGVPDINQYYPAFTLAPAATVDEGNNWINMFYGPLSYSNPTQTTTPGTAPTPLGNYNTPAPYTFIGAAPYSVRPK